MGSFFQPWKVKLSTQLPFSIEELAIWAAVSLRIFNAWNPQINKGSILRCDPNLPPFTHGFTTHVSVPGTVPVQYTSTGTTMGGTTIAGGATTASRT